MRPVPGSVALSGAQALGPKPVSASSTEKSPTPSDPEPVLVPPESEYRNCTRVEDSTHPRAKTETVSPACWPLTGGRTAHTLTSRVPASQLDAVVRKRVPDWATYPSSM